MDFMSIFQGILSTDGSFLDLYLDSLKEHGKFGLQNNDEAGLVQHITSLLTTSKTRILGLRLLDNFIDTCSTDVLGKKGNLWTTSVIKVCFNHDQQSDAAFSFHVLNKIVKSSHQVPDFSKSFASTHLSKLYENLTNVPSSKSKYSLNCIETCLSLYPGSSGPSKGIIERYLWKNIDHVDYNITKSNGKCLHLLQQVKGGGIQGVNYKTQWKNYQCQLLSGIHSVYNEMFANCVELYEDKVEQDKVSWETEYLEFDAEPVRKAAQMYNRCRNLIAYLTIALKESFPVEKPIMVKKILNIIVRGLGVNCLMLERNPIADNIALSILLPKLHIDLLNLLQVSIKILRCHLRPYAQLILNLLVDELKWTSSKNVHGNENNFLCLRKKVYDTLSLWCKIFSSGNHCETVADNIFLEIINDITPAHNEFTLKVLSGSRKHVSKKARRKLHTALNEKSNMAKTHSGNSNLEQIFSKKRSQKLCVSALLCLQELIISVANFIKPTTLKMIQSSIIEISALFYESIQKAYLYSSTDSRKEIYNVLCSIIMATHHLCPPPTELALVNIYNGYVRDTSPEVRFRCGVILQTLEKIIHPQKESLLFAIDARDIRNTFIKLGQTNLLSEFDLNLSLSLPSENPTSDDKSQNGDDIIVINEDPENHDVELDNIDTEVTTPSPVISENNSDVILIRNELSSDSHMDVIETVEAPADEVNNDEMLTEDLTTTTNNVGNMSEFSNVLERTDDYDDIIVIEEKDEEGDTIDDTILDTPMAKKPKLDNISNDVDKIEKSNFPNVDQDEEQMLAEIASQFIDELE